MQLKNLTLGLFCSAASLIAGTATADIVVAQSVPLTGAAAATGQGLALGSKIYFDHINAEGGINGQKIAHIVKDDAYNPEETFKNTKAFIADSRIVALTGYYGTENVSRLFKQGLFDSSSLSMVGASTGAPLLRDPPIPTLFNTRASYTEEITAIVKHVATLGTKRVAVFAEDNPFGDGALRAAEDAVKKNQLILVVRTSYDPSSPKEIQNSVRDILASKPDTVILISVTPAAAEFVKAFRAAGNYAFLFNLSTANAEEVIKLTSVETAKGLGISQVLPFPYSPQLPVAAEYQRLMGKYAPKGTPFSYSTMEGFINAKVLVAALKKAGKTPTRASVKEALENLGDVDVGGYHVILGANNHVGSRFVDLTVITKTGVLAH